MLIIISQDRKLKRKADYVFLSKKTIDITSFDHISIVGVYETEERALEVYKRVLKKIRQARKHNKTYIYKMPIK